VDLWLTIRVRDETGWKKRRGGTKVIRKIVKGYPNNRVKKTGQCEEGEHQTKRDPRGEKTMKKNAWGENPDIVQTKRKGTGETIRVTGEGRRDRGGKGYGRRRTRCAS